jgi:hypothetical protein
MAPAKSESDDFLRALEKVQDRLRALGQKAPPPDFFEQLDDILKSLGDIKGDSFTRAARDLFAARQLAAQRLAEIEGGWSILTLGLSGPVTPAEFAEVLMAFDTLHRELSGVPITDLVAKIGLAEETAPHSVSVT